MKILFLLISLCGFVNAICDTPISRTNNSANTVLTSTKYNADLNNSYTAINTVDGSCLVDATVTEAKLDTSTLGVLLNAPHAGCKGTRSDAATISIDKCFLAVNGNLITTTVANTVTWGCSGCSSEAASTTYYVYVNDGSTGSTMNLSILTGSPNTNGYDSSNNRVLARFFNNSSSDIDEHAVDQWHINRFIPNDTDWIAYTPTSPNASLGTLANINIEFKKDGSEMLIRGYLDLGTVVASEAQLSLPTGYSFDLPGTDNMHVGRFIRDAATPNTGLIIGLNGNTFFQFGFENGSNITFNPQNANILFNNADRVSFKASFKVEGWTSADI